jgi:DNA-binding CsgD family transcriptional regulator
MSSEALSNVICDIYDAAIDPTRWQRALENTCAFVGGSSAVLFWHDAATERSEALHLFNEDPHYTKLYFEKYLTMNPVFPAATFMKAGEVHTTNDIVPQEELVKTRFYKEWVEPQGIVDAIAVNLEKGIMRASLLNIRMHTTDGVADEEALRRTRLLVPHYQRAVAIGRLFDQSKAAEAALAETLDHFETAVFLVASNGRIMFANGPARTMIEDGSLLRQQEDTLVAVVPESNRVLKDILAAAEKDAASVAIPLSSSPQDRWFANVLPLTSGTRRRTAEMYSAAAAVFVRKTPTENPAPLEALAKQYRLTASEVRILDAVVKVGSVKAMAEMLGISQATVKTHLQNVFRKTDTSRQSDLVRLIAGI